MNKEEILQEGRRRYILMRQEQPLVDRLARQFGLTLDMDVAQETFPPMPPPDDRYRQVMEEGRTVVVNIGRSASEAERQLVAKFQEAGKYVRCDRRSSWGNPFPMRQEAERQEVIEKFKVYLAGKEDLKTRLPELEGKALGCHCYPKACHCDHLAELANSQPETR